jgi:uncharacterized protein YmfQ (DUF2313 family)
VAVEGRSYLTTLQALLPPGAAWSRSPDAELTKLLDALAVEFERIDQRALDLVAESDPATADELLGDWERVLGIVDPGAVPSLADRRARAHGTFIARGGQTPSFFVQLAATWGYEIEISLYDPFTVGRSTVGQALTNEQWLFVWKIHEVSGPAGSDRAEAFRNTVRGLAQSHTFVIFDMAY